MIRFWPRKRFKAGALPAALHPDMKLLGGPGAFSQSKHAAPGYELVLTVRKYGVNAGFWPIPGEG